MPKKVDLTGKVFERLTVISQSNKRLSGSIAWLCRCSCGVEKLVSSSGLVQGSSKSCGCLQKEQIGKLNRTHGESIKGFTKEYRAWSHMLSRCRTKSDPNYRHYGGRGIGVDDKWLSYEAFLSDMGRAPSVNHTLERKDVDKGYNADNCVWADWVTQANNRRNNRYLTLGIQKQSITKWAKAFNCTTWVINNALKSGKTIEEIAERFKYNPI